MMTEFSCHAQLDEMKSEIYIVFLHVNRRWVTGGANAVISANLQHHVGEPYRCLTGWVAQTSEEHTAVGRRHEEKNRKSHLITLA